MKPKRKPMKPVKAWAVVTEDGLIPSWANNDTLGRGRDQLLVYINQETARAVRYVDRLVRVEVREVPR